MSESVQSAWLVPIAGPAMRAVELKPEKGGTIIGRHERCDVHLPLDAVSRFHARIDFESSQWRLTDLKSRWGTFLNGQRVASDASIPLKPGDLIGITPWTFNFNVKQGEDRGVSSMDDVAQRQTMVRTLVTHRAGALAEGRLALLLEIASSLQNAADEQTLAEVLVEAAKRGTGMTNAAFLRPLDTRGRLEVVTRSGASDGASYSRSLIHVASQGVLAAFDPESAAEASQSIVLMHIDAALCAPLMLGKAVAAYLYLDARSGRPQFSPRDWAAASAFCLALGRIGSLALANLKRIDIERRSAHLEAELNAASEAQRWVMPKREITCETFHCAGESRPGRWLGGDFFDLISLDNGCLAVALGDVAGKGAGAAVLMTAAQGFLNAALQSHPPEAAVAQLSNFLSPRQPGDRFLTLWVGVLDPTARKLHYIDAGHGYAFLDGGNLPLRRLDAGENFPIGFAAQTPYSTVSIDLPEHGQLLVVSDGIIEQRNAPSDACELGDQFGIERLRQIAAKTSDLSSGLTDIFNAVITHAGTSALADDATAVLVRW